MTERKMIHLVVKHEWYNKIASGERTEDYREVTPYYDKIFKDITNNDFVCFHRGKCDGRKIFRIKSISIGEGKEEWGAEKGKQYYVIEIGEEVKDVIGQQ